MPIDLDVFCEATGTGELRPHQSWTPRVLFLIALALPSFALGQIETGQWQTLTTNSAQQLPIFFPRPTASAGSPELVVLPLFGPQHLLLPGGKLLIWVGRNDGTALANAIVTVRVPTPGNVLVNGGNRATEITHHTNAEGIAVVFLTVPDAPPANNTGNNGGGNPVAS